MAETVPPTQCRPECGKTRCFFCQRLLEVEVTSLRHTKVRWLGHLVNTMICKDCMIRMGVPDRYPEAMRVCHFCGYPGPLTYSEFWVYTSPAPSRGGSKMTRFVRLARRERVRVRVRACPTCTKDNKASGGIHGPFQ